MRDVRLVILAAVAGPVDFRGVEAYPCFRSVASGPGPASGEEFRHDDDSFPDIDRRHRHRINLYGACPETERNTRRASSLLPGLG